MNEIPKVFGENDVTVAIKNGNVVFYYGTYEFKYINSFVYVDNETKVSFINHTSEIQKLEIEAEKRMLAPVRWIQII